MIVTPENGVFSCLVRGRFSIPNGLGVIFLGWNSLGYEEDRAGCYQRHRTHDNKRVIKRWQNWPENHKTPAQIARQNVFRDGVSAWWALTPEEQQSYTPRNREKGVSGQQLFLREYLRTH